MARELMELKGRVVIFSVLGCPHCLRAKNLLAEHAIPYTDISLDSFPQQREKLKQLSGGKTTVPQIFFNDTCIGGNSELQGLVNNKQEWEKLLKMVRMELPPEGAPTPPDPATAVDTEKIDGEFVCEPDEYAALVRDLKKSGLIKDHKAGVLKVHKKSFYGQNFIDWLVKKKHLDKERAVEMGEELVSRKFGHSVAAAGKKDTAFQPTGYYRLLEDDMDRALNAGFTECAAAPALQVAEDLRRLILNIYDKYLSKDGKKLNYKQIAQSEDFKKYERLTRELQRVQVQSCSREEKLALFINIYNALVIHATINMGHPSSLWQRYKFFNTVTYIVGGQIYSLQDIENGVLRGNRRGVGMFKKPFGKNDLRLQVSLEKCEPLIHFALNCGARSCPPVKTFTAKGVRAELRVAAEAFLETEDALSLNLEKKQIGLSQIFKWYQVDFGGTLEKVTTFHSEFFVETKNYIHASLLKPK